MIKVESLLTGYHQSSLPSRTLSPCGATGYPLQNGSSTTFWSSFLPQQQQQQQQQQDFIKSPSSSSSSSAYQSEDDDLAHVSHSKSSVAQYNLGLYDLNELKTTKNEEKLKNPNPQTNNNQKTLASSSNCSDCNTPPQPSVMMNVNPFIRFQNIMESKYSLENLKVKRAKIRQPDLLENDVTPTLQDQGNKDMVDYVSLLRRQSAFIESSYSDSDSILRTNPLTLPPTTSWKEESRAPSFNSIQGLYTSSCSDNILISRCPPILQLQPPGNGSEFNNQAFQFKRSRIYEKEEDTHSISTLNHGMTTSSNSSSSSGTKIKTEDSQLRKMAIPRNLKQPSQYLVHSQQNTNRPANEFSILNMIPQLISEKNRKAAFVENLVDTGALIIEVIWCHFHINPAAKIIPLRIFLQETLRRSRTSYSTLQTALFYLFRIKSQITSRAFLHPAAIATGNNAEIPPTPTGVSQRRENNDPATCGRRMFLAALIVASKYLQDRNYSNKAWSKISGLPVNEINQNEIIFLKLIDYNLFIGEDIFKRWSSLLLTHIQAISGTGMDNANAFRQEENQREVERFRETLKTMDPIMMQINRDSVVNRTNYPFTPESSAPGSPREDRSEAEAQQMEV
ncbi:hypothetical protein G9A89_022740 [Geosiphon pyriformis]|nr:hypothetical protein G9A89_022740 [Geosiphon pyriformis]